MNWQKQLNLIVIAAHNVVHIVKCSKDIYYAYAACHNYAGGFWLHLNARRSRD